MSGYSKKTWFFIAIVIIAMLLLIGVIEVKLPEGDLSTMLMLGVTALGYSTIFVWLYVQRTQPTPAKPTGTSRLAWLEREQPFSERPTFEGNWTLSKAMPDNLKSRYN